MSQRGAGTCFFTNSPDVPSLHCWLWITDHQKSRKWNLGAVLLPNPVDQALNPSTHLWIHPPISSLELYSDGDHSHEIKRRLLLGRKVMTNLDSILKSRDIILSTKVHLVKAMVFPVVIYGCESWTIKKAECQRIDAFELWCWRRLLRVPWTARRSNQSILEISPGCSLEGLMLNLKL